MGKLILITLFLSFALGQNVHATASIEGRYWTDDRKGIIEMYLEGEEIKGRILWRSSPLLDSKNPDPGLRGRSMIGVTFLTGFTEKGDAWKGGRVYSPDNGRTYRGKLWLEDDGQILKMRGFIGVSLLGRTASFTRLTASESVPEGK